METNSATADGRLIGMPRIAPGIVRRERLLARLRPDAPLIVVRGPVSSGKTTLVAQWLNEVRREGDVVWVRRDLEVGSRVACWQQVLDALRSAGLIEAGIRERTLDEFEGDDRGLAAVQRVLEQLPRPLTLVLDGFGPPGAYWDRVADDLMQLLQRTPRLQVITVGRSRTRLESTEAGLQVDRVILDDSDLRATLEELHAIAAGTGLADLTDETLRELGNAADWLLYPARYALETAARTGADVGPALVRGLDRQIIEHLEQSGQLDFAGRVALAPYVTVEFARELTGEPDPAERFDQLAQSNLGALVAGQDGSEVFRFTGRARAALVEHAERAHPTRSRTARRAIAEWLRRRGDDALAAELAMQAEDLVALETILVAAWGTVSREKGALLVPLLLDIDRARILKHPVLSLYLALVLNVHASSQAAAVPYFRAAIAGSRRRGREAPARERFLFATGESIAARLTGDARTAHIAAKRAVELDEILSHDDRSSFGETLPIMMSQCGQSACYAGDFSLARHAFLRAIDLGARSAHASTTNGWLGWLALLDALEGRMRSAREQLDRIDDRLWSDATAQGYAGAGRVIANAYLAIDAGRFADARKELEVLAPHFATIEHWAIIATTRALATALGGAPAEAAAELRRLLEARDDEVGSAGLAAREVAGTDGVLEMLELLHGGIVVDDDVRGRPHGRSASTRLAIRAVRAALAGRGEAAARLLGHAESSRTAPLQDLLVAIAGVVIDSMAESAERDDPGRRAFAIRIAMIVEQESLHWPLALLAVEDRERLVDALGDSPLTPGLEAAFGRVPPVRRAESQVVVLTDREREVLLALVTADTRGEIAARQFVSVNTVRTHMKSLYRKLGVGDREAAILRGVELGLLDPSAAADRPLR